MQLLVVMYLVQGMQVMYRMQGMQGMHVMYMLCMVCDVCGMRCMHKLLRRTLSIKAFAALGTGRHGGGQGMIQSSFVFHLILIYTGLKKYTEKFLMYIRPFFK